MSGKATNLIDAMLADAIPEIAVVWAIVQLCSPGHPWFVLDIVLLVLLVPGLFANRVARKV